MVDHVQDHRIVEIYQYVHVVHNIQRQNTLNLPIIKADIMYAFEKRFMS